MYFSNKEYKTIQSSQAIRSDTRIHLRMKYICIKFIHTTNQPNREPTGTKTMIAVNGRIDRTLLSTVCGHQKCKLGRWENETMPQGYTYAQLVCIYVHVTLATQTSHYEICHLKTIAAFSILTLKVLITRAPVKECSAFRIKQ